MGAGRVLGAGICLLVAASAGWAQSGPLAETVRPGDCFQLQLDMKLTGTLRVQKNGRLASIDLKADSSHAFVEKALAVTAGGLIDRSARVYEKARAVIVVDGERTQRTLRNDRNLLVAQRQAEKLLVYCPTGALTQGELDLTSEHLDTLSLPGLLPGKEVAEGATWKLNNLAVQSLCGFEGLTEHTLNGKLESVRGDLVTFSVAGTASGIDLGAQVKMTVEATGQLDRKTGRVVDLVWKQKDERDQGPGSPASTLETTHHLQRKAIDLPTSLSEVALVSVPSSRKVPPTMLQLDLRDPKGRFSLFYPREWRLVAQTEKHVVLRLLDRGDFIAQVTLTPWTAAEKGKHLSEEEFKTAMNDTSGWAPEKALQESVVPSDKGRWVYRYSVLGQLNGLAVLQSFYLVATPNGEQMVLTFTMTPKQADRLGARDLTLVEGVEMPSAK